MCWARRMAEALLGDGGVTAPGSLLSFSSDEAGEELVSTECVSLLHIVKLKNCQVEPP